MNDTTNELQVEASRFAKQLQARYGLPLLQNAYGGIDECVVTVIVGMTKNGTTAEEFKSVREWLLAGLKPFVQFPPTLEALIQLSNLVKGFPVTPYSQGMKDAWFRLDAEYSQRYGKMWKGEQGFDALTKERVWLAAFEELAITPAEVLLAMDRITASALFRTFVPKPEQFTDTVLAIRCGNAPMIEEAWIMAVGSRPGAELHPLVKKARGKIGALEINTNVHDSEKLFKMIYREMLLTGETVHDEVITAVQPSYMDKNAILDIFGAPDAK